ncbi:MAG: exodeoxyribonuclease V subunit gamma [Spirochaetota bacterium]|nr:exodeoxyribonuclease V subunit gamma [Spirochaetota bacterium]
MPELKLYMSNRLEILADRLACSLEEPLQSPLIPEIIIVQSRGMKRWISLQLAQRFGIWSNYRFPFPNEMVNEIFQAIFPDTPVDRFFDMDVIAWRIMRLLHQSVSMRESEDLDNYLRGGDYSLKRYQLSVQIANVFDQYLTYRPEMILEWDRGEDNCWQAELWRLIVEELSHSHPPALRGRFLERILDPSILKRVELPERISVFGISSLPSFHMDVLTALSASVDVNLFIMNPSQKYWADISSERDIAKSLSAGSGESPTAENLHLEKGNSLLASMGKLGRDFLWIIMEYYDPLDHSCFEEPGDDSLLHLIQSDILNMIDRGASPLEGDTIITDITEEWIRDDKSVTIHSCHSPMREIEVLKDFLLDLFNSSPELEPRDIIVMTPDIEAYSPFIQSVFQASTDDSQSIPFSIADMSIRRESRVIDTFFAVLDLAGGRFEASRVLDIIECEEVLQRFNLQSSDIELIRRWVSETHICWGVEARDRGEKGLPEFRENTWNAGIDRLLLGYAMSGNGESMFMDILPYENIEGSESLILGRFIELSRMLSDHVSSLVNLYTLSQWDEVLLSILDNLFLDGEDAGDIQILREAISRLIAIEEESNIHEKLELVVVRTWLEHALNQDRALTGFLSGRVTFCAMLPMRSIPFKVVCLIGMNNDAFPRTTKAVSFDLIANNPKRGDRSKRIDDRYLFLESIISARETLFISYIGQGIQDNSDIPPSVLVSELIDYIEQGFKIPDGIITDHILFKHRLLAFSSRYFDNSGNLFSYSEENLRACKVMLNERKQSTHFIIGRLSGYDGEDKVIDLNNLIKFFSNPAKHLLTSRLGIYLDERSNRIIDREPFHIDSLDKYYIEQKICSRFLKVSDIDSLYGIIRSEGLLPHGMIGHATFKNLIPEIQRFGKNVKSHMNGEMLDPLDVNLDIYGYKLIGRIQNIWPTALLCLHYTKANAMDKLKAWVLHLILNALNLGSSSKKTILICKDSTWEMEPLNNAFDLLEKLLHIYDKGKDEILHFFPTTSCEYALWILKEYSHKEALNRAIQKWEGSDFSRGDREDPYYNLSFGRVDPFESDFAELSKEVFMPLLTHQIRLEK